MIQVIGAAAVGVPTLWFAAHLFNIWRDPRGSGGRRGVRAAVAVFVMEFLVLHSGAVTAFIFRDNDGAGASIVSLAVLVGPNDRWVIAALQLLFVALLLAIGWLQSLSAFFYFGVAGAAALMVYQHRLIARREREKCFRAFLHNNWVGLTIFAGLALSYI